MNNFVIYYVSGWAFYLGLSLILFAVVGSFITTTTVRKYNITLIPKYRFAAVFAGADSTVDGLHLANKGHRKMAKMILEYLKKTE